MLQKRRSCPPKRTITNATSVKPTRHNQEEDIREDGQKKLATIMHSFALAHSTIVYVGSSPGDGWISAMQMYPNVERIISIDPRPLAQNDDSRIQHFEQRVVDPDGLYGLITHYTNCVLLWDVRGDAPDDSRDELILSEISLLNSILNDARLEKHLLALHLKINMRHACSYELPARGRFFLQPYTLRRDVFEARYVVHLRSDVEIEYFAPTAATRDTILQEMERVRDELSAGSLSEGHLVANMMCARSRRIDYIRVRAYNHPAEEIALFTINHNPPSDVLHYITGLRDRGTRYIVSYFLGVAKCDDPYDFPEGDILLRGLGIVLDSRSLIQAKLEGLYFLFSDNMLTLMNEETYTSETYKIRRTEYAIANRSRIPAYDDSRFKACAERNLCFPKFPSAFSVSQSLVSPSGHALRMTLEHLAGEASMAMLAQKIINNFRMSRRSHIRSEFGATVVEASNSPFAQSLRHHGSTKLSLERSPSTIWHSKLEWIIGIEAAIRLSSPDEFHASQLRAICSHIERTVTCPLPGTEISSFMNRVYGSINPLSQARCKPRVPETTNPDEPPVDVASRLYDFLKTRGAPDPVRWLTRSPHPRSSLKLWREAIVRLKGDACARDYLIHTTIFSIINEHFPDHDISKRDPLEFTLNVLSRVDPSQSKHMHLLHYWRNSHHPEHRLIRRISPDLERVLNSMPTLADVLFELSRLQASFDAFPWEEPIDEDLLMSESEIDEMIVDLLARRWQKDLHLYRGFSSMELCNVPFEYINKPSIPLGVVRQKLADIAAQERVFLRFEASHKLKTKHPDISL